MRTLDRYIGLTVAKSIGLVLLVLLSLFTFITFADELSKTGNGNYGTWDAAEYAIVTIPRMVYQLFPATALIGSMVGLGILANNSELTAMRAAGVSIRWIAGAVMKVGIVLVLAVVFVGEFVAPAADRYAETQKSLAVNDKIALKTRRGLWVREGGSFVNIRDVYEAGRVGGVVIFDFDKQHQLDRVTRAQEAIHQGKNRWLLKDMQVTDIHDGTITTASQGEASRASLLSPGLVDAVTVRPESMSVWELYGYASYLRANGLDAARYVQAFWSKLIAPLTTAIMVLLAIPFIFGPLRTSSAGNRILTGTILGISFHIFGEIFGYVGLVYGLNPVFAASFPAGAFLFVALFMMRKIR